jgi:hypothetical protein
VAVKALLLAVLLALAVPSSAPAAWDYYAPPVPPAQASNDYLTKVDFVQVADTATTGYFDPIKFPGQSNITHQHTFSCNLSIGPSSTAAGNIGDPTNCGLSTNGSAYWLPSVKAGSTWIYPDNTNPGGGVRVYYRNGAQDATTVQRVPAGLQMIAGNSDATAPQSAAVAGWHCRNSTGAVTSKQAVPPGSGVTGDASGACPLNSYLEASVTFPNCWDGTNLTSSNQSHVAYTTGSPKICPVTHQYQFPQITIAHRFPTNAHKDLSANPPTNKAITVATKSGTSNHPIYGLHADWQDGWDPDSMDYLIENCIHAEIGCEGITDTRYPPGTTPPW